MHGVKLLALADIVGLSQSAIAAHFGINRSQVNRWARGQRQIPQRFLSSLMDLVFQAAKCSLAQLTPNGFITLAEIRDLPTRETLCTQITELLLECINENMELDRRGPTASVASTLVALEAFQGMSPADMRKPVNTQRLVELATYLLTYGKMVSQLGPILDLVSEEDLNDNDCSKPKKPGAAGPANASAQ